MDNNSQPPRILPPLPPSERHAGPPPTKRQKVAIACDVCRAKKVKCDGLRPICSPCARRSDRGVPCEYTSEVRTSHGPSKGYVHHLELKLRELQAEKGHSPTLPNQRPDLSTFQSINNRGYDQPWSSPTQQFGDGSEPPHSATRDSGPILTNGGRAQNGAVHRLISPKHRHSEILLHKPTQRPLIFKKARTRTARPTHHIAEYDNTEFFGSKTAGSFVQQIKAAIDARVTTPSPSRDIPVVSGEPLDLLPTVQAKSQSSSSVEYVLPPRKAADALLDIYWSDVHPLYPFLDRRQFQRMYEGVWAGEPTSSDESLMMCTLNVVFALASQFSENLQPEERESSARRYFDRAQDLLSLDLWDIGSVQLVQNLLLMGQYLQGTNSPHQAWIITGLTVRLAEGLGLHLPETSVRIDDVHQRELVRRLWHGCVMMDRILSMQFNRPAMADKLGSNPVPLPRYVDDEHMDRGQPPDQPPVIAFYIKTLELFEVMAKIMQNSATLNRGLGSSPPDAYHRLFGESNIHQLTETLKLDQSLMTWSASLPHHIRPQVGHQQDQKYDLVFHRQSNVLHSRFLHTRILLFRPILARFCLSSPDFINPSSSQTTNLSLDSLPHNLALSCSTLCLEAAHDAISNIYTNLDREHVTGPIPQWWNCILFTYSAATVLQAARLHPRGLSSHNIENSWRHALEILRSFGPLSPLVQRCILALEILADKVTETTSRSGSRSRNTHLPPPLDSSNPHQNDTQGSPTSAGHRIGSAPGSAQMSSPTALPRFPDSEGSAPPASAAEPTSHAQAMDVDGEGPSDPVNPPAAFSMSLGVDFDLHDMSWLTSAPVNL